MRASAISTSGTSRVMPSVSAKAEPKSVLAVVAAASQEVRSGIVYATFIIVLVFVPLFALSGIEGRLFAPLGIAYIVAILASLATSITVTPVLCYFLLPTITCTASHGDGRLISWLKTLNSRLLEWAFRQQTFVVGCAAAAVVALGLFLCVEYMHRPYCYIDGQAVYDKDVAMRTTVYLQGFSEFADPEHLVEELIVND